jgi:hypothetical protein
MSFHVIVSPLRRQILVVLVVLAVSAIVGYDIHSSPAAYSQSATVVFTVTKSLARLNVSGSFTGSMVATETMMAATLTSPAVQSQIREAGGSAPFTVVPFNLYNLQYPEYAAPSATLTVTSPSRAAVRATFALVFRFLSQRLAGLQAQAGVPRPDRIRTYLVGVTSPAPHEGSPARVFGGLAVLALMSVFTIANLLDRHAGHGR